MKLRSLLFVPGDSEKKFVRASQSGADVLILDLEDAVAPSMKEAARAIVAGWIDRSAEVSSSLFVRVNPLTTGLAEGDLAAVVRPGLAGILIPKADGAQDVATIAAMLDRWRLPPGWRWAACASWWWRPRRQPPCSIWAAIRRRIRALSG